MLELTTRRYNDTHFEVCHVTQKGTHVSLKGLYRTEQKANSALTGILEHCLTDRELPPEQAVTRLYHR